MSTRKEILSTPIDVLNELVLYSILFFCCLIFFLLMEFPSSSSFFSYYQNIEASYRALGICATFDSMTTAPSRSSKSSTRKRPTSMSTRATLRPIWWPAMTSRPTTCETCQRIRVKRCSSDFRAIYETNAKWLGSCAIMPINTSITLSL